MRRTPSPTARHRLQSVRRSLRLPLVLAVSAALAGGVVVGISPDTADAAAVDSPIVFGAAGSSRQMIEQHEKVLGSKLNGARVYRSWGQPVFSSDQLWARDTGHTLFVSIKSVKSGNVVKWGDIAAARPGSALYQDMQAQAAQIKAFGARVYVTFNHEPEAGSSRTMGTPAQFAAAWRTWVGVLRGAGATNARYVFTATAYGYARKDSYSASLYYPGDSYVDDIAADAYNWGTCRSATANWRELSSIIDAHRRFGQLHPTKGLMLLEFGSAEDAAMPGRKAQWLSNARALFKQSAYSQYKAVISWEGRAYDGSKNCQFDYLSSASATTAWRSMGLDAAYSASIAG
jgi:hypothetical protein